MIQYKKLKIKRGNQVIGYLYFQENEVLTINRFRQFLISKNVTTEITDAEIQSIIDAQIAEGAIDACCTDPYPITPIINYTVQDFDTIIFTITNYNSNQDYIIKVYDGLELLSTINYTEPLGIDLDPGLYRFEIETSTCSGSIKRDYSVELGNITVTLNIHGNLKSNQITSPAMSTTIQSFVGDNVNINSEIIDQIDHLWKINSILVDGAETINNEVYDITLSRTDNVYTKADFVIDNIQQSKVINIYSNYNIIEWCLSGKCLECVYETPTIAPPIAIDDTYETAFNTLLTVNDTLGILSNDTNNGVSPLVITVMTNVSNGILTLNQDGSFEYQPNLNFSGEDSFTYKIFDSNNQEDTATVTIEVRPKENCKFSIQIVGYQPSEILDILGMNPTDINFATPGLYTLQCDLTHQSRVVVKDRVTGAVYLDEITTGSYNPSTGRYFTVLTFNKPTNNHFTITYTSTVQSNGEYKFRPIKVCEEV